LTSPVKYLTGQVSYLMSGAYYKQTELFGVAFAM
jgi:hypothetical protein